jgi:hypothetical protein
VHILVLTRCFSSRAVPWAATTRPSLSTCGACPHARKGRRLRSCHLPGEQNIFQAEQRIAKPLLSSLDPCYGAPRSLGGRIFTGGNYNVHEASLAA